ncbi:12573_t:CDS:2 [Dentiscutata erythropus]|uniref:12573_t:CDS:1 n=1 Tax=Dentiscutata erythropus TaxID=1348616 RepID=A0A9N9FNB4_9GLOM|nr:12573_t:CDS:2 [Dentiscutata erythropus]
MNLVHRSQPGTVTFNTGGKYKIFLYFIQLSKANLLNFNTLDIGKSYTTTFY